MKLRINNDTIRLRLSKAEVETFVTTGSVSSACHIIDKTLAYSLAHRDDTLLSAQFLNGHLTVFLPTSWIENWHIDERVGFDGKDQNGLYLLIEKDFQCLLPREHEDESDLYFNPQAK